MISTASLRVSVLLVLFFSSHFEAMSQNHVTTLSGLSCVDVCLKSPDCLPYDLGRQKCAVAVFGILRRMNAPKQNHKALGSPYCMGDTINNEIRFSWMLERGGPKHMWY